MTRQLAINPFFSPMLNREVLLPFEVADYHAAGVGDDVWEDDHVPGIKFVAGGLIDGSVG